MRRDLYPYLINQDYILLTLELRYVILFCLLFKVKVILIVNYYCKSDLLHVKFVLDMYFGKYVTR